MSQAFTTNEWRCSFCVSGIYKHNSTEYNEWRSWTSRGISRGTSGWLKADHYYSARPGHKIMASVQSVLEELYYLFLSPQAKEWGWVCLADLTEIWQEASWTNLGMVQRAVKRGPTADEKVNENIHAITQFLEASKDQTQLPLTLQSTEGEREEKSKHRQSKPRPQCLLQSDCCRQEQAGKGCGTCKLRVRSWSWSCWILFGLAAKIHSWQWKHFHPFHRCWGSPPSVLKLSLNFFYDLILHKAPDKSGVPSSSLVEWHSLCFLINPWSATTGTCLANRFPTQPCLLLLNLWGYFAMNVTASNSTFWSLPDKKRNEKKEIIFKPFLSKSDCQSQFSTQKALWHSARKAISCRASLFSFLNL